MSENLAGDCERDPRPCSCSCVSNVAAALTSVYKGRTKFSSFAPLGKPSITVSPLRDSIHPPINQHQGAMNPVQKSTSDGLLCGTAHGERAVDSSVNAPRNGGATLAIGRFIAVDVIRDDFERRSSMEDLKRAAALRVRLALSPLSLSRSLSLGLPPSWERRPAAPVPPSTRERLAFPASSAVRYVSCVDWEAVRLIVISEGVLDCPAKSLKSAWCRSSCDCGNGSYTISSGCAAGIGNLSVSSGSKSCTFDARGLPGIILSAVRCRPRPHVPVPPSSASGEPRGGIEFCELNEEADVVRRTGRFMNNLDLSERTIDCISEWRTRMINSKQFIRT